MINKYEVVGIAVSIGLMSLALWFLQLDKSNAELSMVNADSANNKVFVGDAGDQQAALATALTEASSGTDLEKLIIDDVVIGGGEEVKTGDIVTVNYIGTLKNGQQFDNSYEKGAPLSFTVGQGRVIAGWDQGLVGMKVGGKRILVVPSSLGYGKAGGGPIPPNSTLVFAIELLSID